MLYQTFPSSRHNIYSHVYQYGLDANRVFYLYILLEHEKKSLQKLNFFFLIFSSFQFMHYIFILSQISERALQRVISSGGITFTTVREITQGWLFCCCRIQKKLSIELITVLYLFCNLLQPLGLQYFDIMPFDVILFPLLHLIQFSTVSKLKFWQ